MSAPTTVPKATDVPAQVFEQFLADLAGAEIPTEVITRLRKTLLEDRVFTDSALKQAIFGEEPAPEGFPDNVVRTVGENCRTLKFTQQEFAQE